MKDLKLVVLPKSKIIFSLVFLVLISIFSVYQLRAPKAKTGDILASEFSADRAYSYINDFAVNTHPSSSDQNEVVSNYIQNKLSEFGVQPEIQITTSVDTKEGTAMPVKNIIAKIPGTNSEHSILFVSHYDSALTGPGASDDGVAVGSMLETLRALKNNPSLKNDIIFLFTDGEETYSGGAKAFVADNPLFRDVSMVFNYEARGVSGPVIMFETTPNNSHLISEFAKAVPNPMAFSYLYEVYKNMPNGTDFSYFKDKNIQGLNFAFPFQSYYYHTALDNIDNLSKDSIEHDGQYMFSLAKYFGDDKTIKADNQEAVYSNVLGLFFFHYSHTLSIVFVLALAILFLWQITRYVKSRTITIKKALFGFLVFLLTTITATGTTLLLYLGKQWLFDKNIGVFAETYLSWIYFIIAIGVALLSFLLFYNFKWIKNIGQANLAVGALFIWFLLSIFSTFFLSGFSYLFVWPLFFGLITFEFILRQQKIDVKNLIVILLLAIPAIVLFVPFVYLLFVAMGTMIITGTALLFSLLLGLFIPQIYLFSANSKIKLLILIISIVVLFGSATLYSAFNSTNHPRMDGVVYVQNDIVNKSYWVSLPGQPIDKYISEYLVKPRKDVVPNLIDVPVSISDAPMQNGLTPNMSLVSKITDGDTTLYNLKVTYPQQHFTQISLYAKSDIGKAELVDINNQTYNITDNLKKDSGFGFINPPQDGIELRVEAPKETPLSIEVDRMVYGLPSSLAKQRPKDTIVSVAMDLSFFIQKFNF